MKHQQSPQKRLWSYALPWHSEIKWASFYSLINKFFDIFPEILIGIAIDVVVEKDQSFLASMGFVTPVSQLTILGILTFVIWVLESMTEYQALVRWRYMAQRVQHSLRMDGVSHCQKLDLSWYEDQNTGTLLATLNEDVNQVEQFLNKGLHDLLQLGASTFLVGMVFFYISPMVALLAILPIPLIVWGGVKFRSRLETRYLNVRKAAAQLSGILNGVLNGVVTIRAANAEQLMVKETEARSQTYLEMNREAIKLSTAFVPLIRVAVLMGFLFTLVWGGLETFAGEISPAAYTVLVFLTQRLLWPFTRFGEVLDLHERSMASATRVLDLLHTPVLIKNKQGAKPLSNTCGSIEFENVRFGYDPDRPVLDDFHMKVPAGSFVALVGSTGSGKSTITRLLMRFYEQQQGTIFLDGVDIRDYKIEQLRRQIGYVSQEVFLIDGTVDQNLRLQAPDSPPEEIAEVAKLAEADGFISALPKGYEALVGERGQKLSGGQRQRLAIARSLLGAPPILILDEATAAVDNETEAAIQRSLERLIQDSKKGLKQRTVMVVAHRLSTIRNADHIFVLEGGKVIESGNHEALLAKGGRYDRLWKIQTGETVTSDSRGC